MQNRKYFPFERNNYYYGKLLTARDFESEQRYFNDKRRFLNRLTGGNGIVAGLGVISADDVSVIIQAGCAFDGSGREIVIPETRVVKLSTIEGYGALTGRCAYLGIAYDEKPADEAFAVMSPEEGAHYNRTHEHYKLALLDEALAAKLETPVDEYVSRTVLYSDAQTELLQFTPKYIPQSCVLRLRVRLRRIGEGSGEYTFGYHIEAPGFETESGSTLIRVSCGSVRLARGETHELEYILTPQPHLWNGDSSVSLSVSQFFIKHNGEALHAQSDASVSIKPVRGALDAFCLSGWYGKSMDKELGDGYDKKLWLAKINLIRQNNNIIIDSVEPPPFEQYVYNPQQLMLLRRLEWYYPSPGALQGDSAALRTEYVDSLPLPEPVLLPAQEQSRVGATGVFDLSLGLGYGKKEVTISPEIMHGLGKGPVYVDVGVEYIVSTKNKSAEDASEIITGDIGIFDDDSRRNERVSGLSTAVKVLPERGTFLVGVRIDDTHDLISLRMRWFAFRLNEAEKQIRPAQEGERYILIKPDTFVLQPKGTAHITPVFVGMPSEACTFSLVDSEGGSVDNNGVYTAPTREGVFEIRVQAMSDPTIFAHAFAIVSQKKKE